MITANVVKRLFEQEIARKSSLLSEIVPPVDSENTVLLRRIDELNGEISALSEALYIIEKVENRDRLDRLIEYAKSSEGYEYEFYIGDF